MRKRFLCILMALTVIVQLLVFSVAAESTVPEGNTPAIPPTESKPVESTPVESIPTESAPSEGSNSSSPDASDPTQGSTPPEPSQPVSCSHSYGDWDADEGNHWKTCTICGNRESSGHSWATETVTVDPTCGEAGGVCKICMVCQGVLVTQLIPPTGKHTYDNVCDTSCNVCGAAREVVHTFGTGWKYGAKGHWHYCTVCGAADELKAHYPGPAATEETEQICLTCGMVMMKKKDHTHKWDITFSSDDSSHWYACSGCREKKDVQNHSYDDGCDSDCNICTYLRTTAHDYDGWQNDDTAHWQICNSCGEESEHTSHEMTQGETKEQQMCNICLFEITVTHVHDYPEEWKQDERQHWLECECAEKAQSGDHIWDEGREENDLIIYKCEICQAEKRENAPEEEIPWFLFAACIGILVCLIGIVICILLIRKHREEYL